MIVGIDPGLATCGFAVLDGEGRLYAAQCWTSKKSKEVGDTRRRLDGLLEWIDSRLVEVTVVTAFVVEFPAANKGLGRSFKDPRAYLATGTVYGHVRSKGAPVLCPVPITWRSAAGRILGVEGSKGNEEFIHAKLDERYGVIASHGKTKAPHVLDAIGCATYGLSLFAAQLALVGADAAV